MSDNDKPTGYAKFTVNGEVMPLEVYYCSCGDAQPGIHIGFERFQDEHSNFDRRGGTLNAAQATRLRDALTAMLPNCQTILRRKDER